MITTSEEWKDNVYNPTEKKIRLTVGDTVLTDDDIQGKVEIQETCTNSEDIKIGSCIASSLKFNITNIVQSIDFLNNDIKVDVGIKIPETGEFEFVSMGIFLVDEIDDKDERVFKITARDKMKLFDLDCTEFIEARTYPVTLFNLTKQLCNYVGIELENTSIINGDYLIEENFDAIGFTCQQLLSWIGEVSASFVNVNRHGKLVFKTFTSITNNITDRDYINITAAKYTVPQITRLQVAVQEDDLGVVVGTGDITYTIINNPLLYTKSEEQITPAMTNILSVLQAIPVYTPVKLYGKGNPTVETADVIHVTTVKGEEIDVLVMDRKFVYQKSFRDTYESFGTASVGEKKIVQSSLVQLKGKMNNLTRNLNENTLKLVDVEKGYSEIFQKVGQNTLKIADVEGNVNTITQDLNCFKVEINNTVEDSYTEAKSYTDQQIEIIELTPGPQGPKGDKGTQGPKGDNGQTSYFHVAYADTSTGGGFSQDSSGKEFIGTYVDFNSADSSDPTRYTWVLMKGAQGEKGEQGIAGINGIDGQTSYLHIAYADDSSGNGFNQSPTGKAYMGTYTDFTSADSTDHTKYRWTKIKGETGPRGPKGSQGIPGIPGADGKTTYTWVKYADTPTSGMSDSPTGKKYLGIAVNKTIQQESTNYSDYKWSKIKGEQGVPGEKGADGKTTYTWVKYADTPTSGISDDPTGKKYIGFAFNKAVPTESSNYSDYVWSLMPQNIEVGGRNYIPHTEGEWHTTGISSNSAYGVYKNNLNYIYENLVGLPLMASFDVKIDTKDGSNGQIQVYGSNGSPMYTLSNKIITGITTEWQRVSTPISISKHATNTGQGRIEFWGMESKTTKIYIRRFKLEKGNTATDWTPAPEDVEQKFTNYYTKTETDTNISAATEGINLSVDTKITNTRTQINARTDEVLENYSTKTEINTALELAKDEIELSINEKVLATYYQEATPTNPKVGEFWYKTKNKKLYRYNGTTWQIVEDSDITSIKSDVARINISVEGITQKVKTSEDKIGQLELKAKSFETKISEAEGDISTIEQTVGSISTRVETAEGDISSIEQNVGSLKSRMSSAEGNISTLKQTNTSLSSRIKTAEGNISTLKQTASSVESRISGAEGKISSIKQTTDKIQLAVNNSKLVFNSSGLTINNGGFYIKNGSTTLLSSSSGSLYLRGELRTGYVTVNGNSVWISPYRGFDGTPSGGRIYFSTSSNATIIYSKGWSNIIETSRLRYKQNGNSRHEFSGGDVHIDEDVHIDGNLYVDGKRIN